MDLPLPLSPIKPMIFLLSNSKLTSCNKYFLADGYLNEMFFAISSIYAPSSIISLASSSITGSSTISSATSSITGSSTIFVIFKASNLLQSNINQFRPFFLTSVKSHITSVIIRTSFNDFSMQRLISFNHFKSICRQCLI